VRESTGERGERRGREREREGGDVAGGVFMFTPPAIFSSLSLFSACPSLTPFSLHSSSPYNGNTVWNSRRIDRERHKQREKWKRALPFVIASASSHTMTEVPVGTSSTSFPSSVASEGDDAEETPATRRRERLSTTRTVMRAILSLSLSLRRKIKRGRRRTKIEKKERNSLCDGRKEGAG
jgi:hypothetical protein